MTGCPRCSIAILIMIFQKGFRRHALRLRSIDVGGAFPCRRRQATIPAWSIQYLQLLIAPRAKKQKSQEPAQNG
jgi:hypothetical protein